MDREIIIRVEALDTGELLLGLKGEGKPTYQYVYRAAAGVCWNDNKPGFESTRMKEWSYSRWYKHIVEAVYSELGVELILGSKVAWINIPNQQKEEILHTKII